MKLRNRLHRRLAVNRAKGRARRADKLDPTRTLTLRRNFTVRLRQKFALLKGRIVKLILEEDALGLKSPPVGNAFCPTGEGGGKDNSCGSSISGLDKKVALTRLKGEKSVTPEVPLKTQQPPYIKAPFKQDLTEGLREDLASVADKGKRKETELEISSLIGTQDAVSRRSVEVMIKRRDDAAADYLHGPVTVVRVNGKNYLFDGHHRATAEKFLGSKTIKAVVYTMAKGRLAANVLSIPHRMSIEGDGGTVYYDQESGLPYTSLAVHNAFCATGEGGGVDATCSPNSSSSQEGLIKRIGARVDAIASKVPGIRQVKDSVKSLLGGIRSRLEKRYGAKAASLIMTSGPLGGYGVAIASGVLTGGLLPVGIPIINDLVSIAAHTAVAEFGLQMGRLKKRLVGNELEEDYEGEAGSIKWVIDEHIRELIYLKSTAIRDQIAVAGLEEEVQQLVSWVKDPTHNTRWAGDSDARQVEQFQAWLTVQFSDLLTGASEEALWHAYIEQGYRKGAGRVFDDLRGTDPNVTGETLDFYRGGRDEFLRSAFAQPVAIEKVKLLAGRAFDELEGVTDEMSRRMSRTLTDGLVQGQDPYEVARHLRDEADLSQSRAETVARTELIRAHSDGQLDAMEKLGVEEVGVMVEWSVSGLGVTAKGNFSPCLKCASMQGTVLKLDEARGMLPLHPNCMCSWIPANVGEDEEEQKRTKKDIDSALEGAGVEEVDISRQRPESVFNATTLPMSDWLELPPVILTSAPEGDPLLAFSQWVNNSFCPTGDGGGIDDSCSPKKGSKIIKGSKPKKKSSWRDEMVASTPWQPGEGATVTKVSSSAEEPPTQRGTASVTTAEVASKIGKLSDASPYQTVNLTDLHDALGRPPIAQMHEHVRSLWSAGAISVEEHEGREQVTSRQLETALMVPSSRTGGLESRITSIYITDRSKLK